MPRELTNYKNFESLPLQKIIELTKTEKIQFEPETQTLYSNVGYFTLHHIIDICSRNGYNDFINKQILSKMNLRNTGEFNSATAQIQNFAYGFDRIDGKIVPAPLSSINRFETGNYYTTIQDLYAFSEKITSTKVLSKKNVLKCLGKTICWLRLEEGQGIEPIFTRT